MNLAICSSALVALLKREMGGNRSFRSLLFKSSKEQKVKEQVGVEEKTSNSCFSTCFSSFYVQNKRANRSSWLFSLFQKSELLFRSQKASNSHKKPKSEFPSLIFWTFIMKKILLFERQISKDFLS